MFFAFSDKKEVFDHTYFILCYEISLFIHSQIFVLWILMYTCWINFPVLHPAAISSRVLGVTEMAVKNVTRELSVVKNASLFLFTLIIDSPSKLSFFQIIVRSINHTNRKWHCDGTALYAIPTTKILQCFLCHLGHIQETEPKPGIPETVCLIHR